MNSAVRRDILNKQFNVVVMTDQRTESYPPFLTNACHSTP